MSICAMYIFNFFRARDRNLYKYSEKWSHKTCTENTYTLVMNWERGEKLYFIYTSKLVAGPKVMDYALSSQLPHSNTDTSDTAPCPEFSPTVGDNLFLAGILYCKPHTLSKYHSDPLHLLKLLPCFLLPAWSIALHHIQAALSQVAQATG